MTAKPRFSKIANLRMTFVASFVASFVEAMASPTRYAGESEKGFDEEFR